MGRFRGGFLTAAIVATGVLPGAALARDLAVPEPPPTERELKLSTDQLGLGLEHLPVVLRQSARVVATPVDGNVTVAPVRLDTALVRRIGDDTLLLGDLAWQPAGAPVARVGGLQWGGQADAADRPLEYRVATGFLRKDYAAQSNSYDDAPVTLASLRAGWTDWLSVEAAAEQVEQLRAGRIAARAKLARAGTLSGSAAHSAAAGATGAQWTQAWELSRGGVDVRAACTSTSGRFRSVAHVQDGSVPARLATDVRLAGPLAGGAAQLSFATAEIPGAAPTRVGTVGYARALPRRWSVAGTASHDLVASSLTTGITLSHTFR